MESLSNLPCASSSIGPANQLLALLIQTLFASQCSIMSAPNWPPDYAAEALKSESLEFDFIVVGSGSAGSVVASRLSENKNHTVLLLEAGADPPLEAEIPSLFNFLFDSNYDWDLYADPSNYSSIGSVNGTFWPRAKMIGGCGSHNGMFYVRGNDRDYNGWADLGNPTWNFNNVLHYFKKSENNGDQVISANKRYHGTDGPLKINHYNFTDPVKQELTKMFVEAGVPFVNDINADVHLGTTYLQGTIFEGTRYSSAKAFLPLTNDRDNFKLIKNAFVTKIDFQKNKVVSGVNFLLNGQNVKAFARKEVILSAGTVGTPNILIHSGIGPKQHLKSMNIGLISDLSVGSNLQDHVIVPFIIALHESTAQNPNPIEIAQDYYEYLTNKTGSFAKNGLSELNAFVSTVGDPKYPDIQFDCGYFTKNTPSVQTMLKIYGYNDAVIDSILAANAKADIIVLLPMILNPKSRGYVSVTSNNPLDQPRIVTGYLTEQEDVETLIRGMRMAQKLLQTDAFRKAEGEFVVLDLPSCDKYAADSDEYWECYIRETSTTAFHPVGTAKMGPASDKDAVVDSTLKVRGVHGLRVIDASIMPVIISGNINAPTIMIGEKGSDFVKQDHDPFYFSKSFDHYFE